jgi:hypothetical protein
VAVEFRERDGLIAAGKIAQSIRGISNECRRQAGQQEAVIAADTRRNKQAMEELARAQQRAANAQRQAEDCRVQGT